MAINVASIPADIDVKNQWLYKAGGISAIAVSVLFAVELGLGIALGKLPGSSGLAWLTFVNDKSATWTGLIYLTVVIDMLFLLVYLVLYSALRPVNRSLMLVGTVFAVFGTVLDEVIANANFGSLLTLGAQYRAAGTAAQRAADLAAADYAAAVLSSRIESIFAFVIPAIGIAAIAVVMLRSPFGRRLGYLGIAAGVFDLLQLTGLDLAALLSTVLQLVWFALVGRVLYRRYAAPVAAKRSQDLLSL